MSTLTVSSRKYFLAASAALREKLAYRGNFAGAMLTYGLFIYIFSRLWAGAFAGRTDISGYTSNMMVWYFIIAEVPSFAFGRFFVGLSAEMKSGDIAYLINRPYGFMAFNYASKIGGALLDGAVILAEGLLLGFLLVGPLPDFAAATGNAGIGMHALRASTVILSLVLSGSINFFLQFSIAMTAFWFEENEAFHWIYQKLTLVVGTLMPIEFLPAAVAKIAWFTPFPYIAYAPARMLAAFSAPEAASLLARQVSWVLFGMLLAKGVFALGSRRLSVNGG